MYMVALMPSNFLRFIVMSSVRIHATESVPYIHERAVAQKD
jgi:hypothetical protein